MKHFTSTNSWLKGNLFNLNYIIGMNQILWMNANLLKTNMTSVSMFGSEINFLKEVTMTLSVQSF